MNFDSPSHGVQRTTVQKQARMYFKTAREKSNDMSRDGNKILVQNGVIGQKSLGGIAIEDK